MKNYSILLICILLLLSCKKESLKNLRAGKEQSIVINNKNANEYKEEKNDISGKWYYEFNSSENELLNRTFEINFVVEEGVLKGQYCAVAKNGNRIDCSEDVKYNISGTVKGNKIAINFYSFLGGKNGEAEIVILNDGSISWKIIKQTDLAENYAPLNCVLKKENSTENFEGLYILNICEDKRFRIKLERVLKDYKFVIYDKNVIISKGQTKIGAINGRNVLKLKNIEASLSGNTMVITNYKNNIKTDKNFSQCDEEYLPFLKTTK